MKKEYICPILSLFCPMSEDILTVSGENPFLEKADDIAEDIFS